MSSKIAFLRTTREDLFTKTARLLKLHENIREQTKRILLIFWFIGNIMFYGIYTNITSTKGYFLAEAKEQKEQIQFSYNITTLNMTEYQRKLRESLHRSDNISRINLQTNVVYLSTETDVSMTNK